MAAAGALGGIRAAAAPLAPAGSGATDREAWAHLADRVASPVLEALAARRLHATMPVEAPDPRDRSTFTHLEAIGRTLCGLAPWLELEGAGGPEAGRRDHLAALAREALDAATDPASPDRANFSTGTQPVVDAAFLAQAVLRAPRALWERLDGRVRSNLLDALESTRAIVPYRNNWLLFASMVECALHMGGRRRDEARLFEGPRRMRGWYKGDGWYGDGPDFHTDYYNAFVIQPMLLEIYDRIGPEGGEWAAAQPAVVARFRRFAAVQERLVAPDGTYPVVGRSIAYRCGAFQGLALAAQRHLLPEGVTPGQARNALTLVIRRTLEAPGTFDDRGWLTVGLSGHQPSLGEGYISTGSLYLCCAAFLPLGLPDSDPFWSAPSARTSGQRAWSGDDMPADHALSEEA